MKRLVILGAGYGGLNLALKLNSLMLDRKDWKVILVNQYDYHLIQVRIHEVAGNSVAPSKVKVPLTELLGNTPVQIIPATVERIKPNEKVVQTSSGPIEYDRLVVALGSVPNFYGIAGMKEYAYPMKSLDDALAYRKAVIHAFKEATAPGAEPLRKNDPRLTFVIIGGGLTGVEMAGEMADFCNDLSERVPATRNNYRVVLLELAPNLLGELGAENGEYARSELVQRNVAVFTNTCVERVEQDRVLVNNGKSFKTSLVCWTGGVKGPALIQESGFETSRDGRIPVDPYLRSTQFNDVYAIGDNALILDPDTGKPLLLTGQYAELQAGYLAGCFKKERDGEKLEPYHPTSLGISISVGRDKALSIAGPMRLTGISGRMVKNLTYTKHELGIRQILP